MIIDKYKIQLDDTEEFVKKHRTGVACTATAVITFCLTRKRYTKIMTDFAYELGKKNGVRDTAFDVIMTFINEKGLFGELDDFIETLSK